MINYHSHTRNKQLLQGYDANLNKQTAAKQKQGQQTNQKVFDEKNNNQEKKSFQSLLDQATGEVQNLALENTQQKEQIRLLTDELTTLLDPYEIPKDSESQKTAEIHTNKEDNEEITPEEAEKSDKNNNVIKEEKVALVAKQARSVSTSTARSVVGLLRKELSLGQTLSEGEKQSTGESCEKDEDIDIDDNESLPPEYEPEQPLDFGLNVDASDNEHVLRLRDMIKDQNKFLLKLHENVMSFTPESNSEEEIKKLCESKGNGLFMELKKREENNMEKIGKYEGVISNLKKKIVNQNVILQKLVKSSENNSNLFKKRIDQLKMFMSGEEKSHSQVIQNLEEKKRKMEERYEDKIERLENELNENKKSVQNLSTELEELKNIRNENNKNLSSLKSLRCKHEELKQNFEEVSEINKKNVGLKDKLGKLQDALKDIRLKCVSLEDSNSNLKNSNESQEIVIGELREQIEKNDVTIDELEGKIKDLKEKNLKESQMGKIRENHLMDRITDFEQKEKCYVDALECLKRTEDENVKKFLEEKREFSEKLEKLKVDKNKQIDKFRRKFIEKSVNCDELKMKLDQSEKRYQESSDLNIKLERENTVLKDRNINLKKKVQEINFKMYQFEDMKCDRDVLRKQIELNNDFLEREATQNKDEIDDLQQVFDKLKHSSRRNSLESIKGNDENISTHEDNRKTEESDTESENKEEEIWDLNLNDLNINNLQGLDLGYPHFENNKKSVGVLLKRMEKSRELLENNNETLNHIVGHIRNLFTTKWREGREIK